MTLFPQRARPDIPDPEGSDAKEVFAFFGLCSYCAQVFEQGIVNLVVALRLRRMTLLTEKDVDALFERSQRKTLGQLLADLRQHVTLPSELEDSLREALADRNYLIHHFFVVHDIDFMSDVGRERMVAELRQIATRFQVLDRQLEPVTHSLFERLGITAQLVQAELARMKAEARARDATRR